jgi:hypothetical protein
LPCSGNDVDWGKYLINIERCWSKGTLTAGKTKVSLTQVAMHPALAEALQHWRRETVYGHERDWIFASEIGSSLLRERKERSRGAWGCSAAVVSCGTTCVTGSPLSLAPRRDVGLATIQAITRHSKPRLHGSLLAPRQPEPLRGSGQVPGCEEDFTSIGKGWVSG